MVSCLINHHLSPFATLTSELTMLRRSHMTPVELALHKKKIVRTLKIRLAVLRRSHMKRGGAVWALSQQGMHAATAAGASRATVFPAPLK